MNDELRGTEATQLELQDQGGCMSLLTVDHLNKSFGGLKAVKDVTFRINKGEIVGLIGPNGSGKTTTLNLLTGFLRSDSGSIQFENKELTRMPRYKICGIGIARTFQIVKPFTDLTALENVMVGRVFGCDPISNLKKAAEEAKNALDKVGLLKKEQVLAKDLTLMERKRLELARALAAKPSLLLLDELMAGLNHAEADEAMKLVRQIRNSNITILIVEHIVKVIAGLSDRIIVLNMGEKIAEGTPKEIINHPEVARVYLGKSHA
jgi:branched-chain amino acid transport system ATP-binding protein